MEALITLALPTDQPCRHSPLYAKEGDYNIRHFAIKLMQGGKQIEISDSATVTVNVKRESDGSAKAFEGTVEDNKAIVPLPAFATEIGDTTVYISVSVYDDGKISTTRFPVYIQSAEYSNDDVSEDENTDILTALIATVTTLNTTVTANEATRQSNEASRVSAETARVTEYNALITGLQSKLTEVETELADIKEAIEALNSGDGIQIYYDEDGRLSYDYTE